LSLFLVHDVLNVLDIGLLVLEKSFFFLSRHIGVLLDLRNELVIL
jgi:hypothetical protein